MRRKLIPPLIVAISVLLAGVAVASSQRTNNRPPADTRAQFDKHKVKAGDDVELVGVWRNCKMHIVRLPAERFVATLPNGEKHESIEVKGRAPDEVERQLPPRDPACDHVEPTREQIDANRAEMEAELQRMNPGRPVRPGG